MSKYTTEVRYICEKFAGKDTSVDYNKVDEVINASRAYIFDFDYPIFDTLYKPRLECKILKHFYTREIGAETVGLWKLFLNRKMNEIMPYYNQRYNSELITFNPLHNTDISVSRNDTFTGNKTDDNTRKTTNSGRDIDTVVTDRDITDGGRNVDTVVTDRDISVEHRGYDLSEYDDDSGSKIKDHYEDSSGSSDTTTGWHYEADTPQSTIAGVNDSNYATRAVKDTNTNNYNKDNENTRTFDQHNQNKTTYNSDDDTAENSTVTDTLVFGKTTSEDVTATDTKQFGRIIDDKENLLQAILNTDAFIEHRTGKSEGETYSEMLNKFRTTFLNIDMEVIEELNPLFFSLW